MSDSELPSNASDNANAIAIVGMAGRFPGAENVEQFWRNLCAGVESITMMSEAQLEDSFSPEVRAAPNFVKARPLLEHVDQFDADFFGMYAREAELTDPQHRLFLECAWEALEDAGHDPARERGAVGVFAGASINTYFLHHVLANRRTIEEFTSNYQVGSYPMLLGAGADFLATRVSYKLDLKGPSVDVQSACSTSLLAVAQACQSLLLYQCDVALAGGVSITFPQRRGYQHLEGGMVSADGHCRPFDARASGTVFGSGVGVVVLKRLADAIADGDQIYAVVLGAGVTNDGAAKVGFTAPGVNGQAAAIEQAHANAGIDPRTIGYVECHGTATPLGDPIEVTALTRAFRLATADRQFCALGSVKSNIGHLDAAAGVVGLIKTALALRHGQRPATLHYERANPQIDFASSPFFVDAALTDWRSDGPRRAGVSAFGVGGTNVHLVLEQAPARQALARPAADTLLLSARSAPALAAMRARLAAHLAAHPELELGAVARTLREGRRAFAYRQALACRDLADARAQLALPAPAPVATAPQAPSVVFMFPGQGSQYPGMGRDLYEHEPLFREHVDHCASLLRALNGLDLIALLYPSRTQGAAEALMATGAAQPAIFTIEYALAQLLMARGIEPVAMIGHSVGEFVAAVLAGVLSLEDALRVVATRGADMERLTRGSMLAVRLAEGELTPLLPPDVAIAAVNGPALCVASGPDAAIDTLAAALEARAVTTRRLHTSHAFHSAMVDPIVAPLTQLLASVSLHAPTRRYVSCTSGTWITPAEATSPEYWARHARQTVRFAAGIQTLQSLSPPPLMIEVGAGNTLTTLALQTLKGSGLTAVPTMQDAARERDDRLCLLEALGQLWQRGLEPHWPDSEAPRVSLPAYPFERQRYWIDAPAKAEAPSAAAAAAAPAATLQAPPSAPPPAAPAGVDATIRALLEELSGEAPPQAPGITFLEMGYDSLFLTQVAQRLQQQLKVKVTFRQLLNQYTSIDALAAFLTEATGAAAPAAPAAAPSSVIATAAPAQASDAPTPAAGSTIAARFQVYVPVAAAVSAAITPEQRTHIAELTATYNARTGASKRFTEQHRAVLADPRAAAGFRTDWKELVYPIVTARSKGSKLWDLDGNEYVDLVNGFGQTAFGHAADFVVDAVREQLGKGFEIGPQAPLAGQIAEAFCEMTGNERMTFCNTGSEAVMAAMRLARTVTGRRKIVIFNGDYHGQFDEVLVKGVQRPGQAPRSVPLAPGIPPSSVENMIVLDYATPATLEWLREHVGELAAVIVEPVQSRHPALQPFEFLREVRALTEAAGTAFVIDEVVTGFRVHPGGIQTLTGIRADLATYGKVVGGGLPIGILAGKAKFMDALDGGQWRYGDESFPEVGVTFFAGTFVRHPLTLAATWAVLQHLRQHGPALQQQLEQTVAPLAARINALFAEYGWGTRAETYASWLHFNVHDQHTLAPLLYPHLRLRGVHIQDGFPCFLTTAHSAADIEHIVSAFRDSLAALAAVGVPGRRDAQAPLAAPAPTTAHAQTAGVPLTESQTEIWLAAQMGDEASCAFNESVTLRLRGRLDVALLGRALDAVFARHDALRARFSATGESMQFASPAPLGLGVTDLAGPDAEQRLAAHLAEDARTPFDLIEGPVARVALLRLAAEDHALVFSAHHIICDGWSVNVIVDELATAYRAGATGATPAWPATLAFSRYAAQQLNRDPQELAQTERYWRSQFEAPVKPLDLPTDRPRPALKSYRGASLTRRIDAALYQRVKKAGAKAGQTLFVTLLGGFEALVGRLCDQQEVVVGVPTAGQSLIEDQVLVGHCVNFLPLRARWSTTTTVREHMSQVARDVLDAYEHQNYTLGTLVRQLALPREANRVALAEIQFNLERLAERISLPGLEVDVEPNAKAFVNFDLFLNVIESEAGLRLDCDYNTDLFDESTIERWLGSYQALLERLGEASDEPLVRVPYLTMAERTALLVTYNDTAVPFDDTRGAHELIAARAHAQPEREAVRSGEQSLTYGELDRRANQLAHVLRAELAGREGARVAVAVERGVALPVALLAVWKAGCAYVPLDASHPAKRLAHVLTDSGAAAIVTDAPPDSPWIGAVPVIHLARDAARVAAASTSPPEAPRSSLAYTIYTSGSTGIPKGVDIEHRALVNFLQDMARRPGMDARDTLLAVTTVAFDIAGLELYLPLTTGARVLIARREELDDGFALLRLLGEGVSVMQATPATWRLLLAAGFKPHAGLKMLCGGEALPRELANELAANGAALWNMYGPTETTIWSACTPVTRSEAPMRVGGPMGNTQFYVLDGLDQPVGHGVVGQLHIGGAGVARGYHARAELTAEKFLTNPFAPGRLFRTGDLARWTADGQIQLLGRIDHQVKLRGYRIELGEIEAALLRIEGIAGAAVMLRTEASAPQLVAYYTVRPGADVSVATLQSRLGAELPAYMVPAAWVALAALPLSPNGKLDRAALPAPVLEAAPADESGYIAPQPGLESTLARIWSEVLHRPRVSADLDLLRAGADSIQIFQIVARASREGIKLTARQMLQARTLRAVAAAIEQSTAGTTGAGEVRNDLPSLSQFARTRRKASSNAQG